MLDTTVKVFHEMTLKLYFMKCLERKISQCILPLRVERIVLNAIGKEDEEIMNVDVVKFETVTDKSKR